MKPVTQRLSELRAAMAAAGADAVILPSSDPHASEYAPAHYTAWEYFSGFSCENSNLVVTADKAAMWVDGRFFGAADAALAGTGIVSMHMKVKGVPTLEEWLGAELGTGKVLAYEADTMSIEKLRELEKTAKEKNFIPRPMCLVDRVWTEDRPPMPSTTCWLLPAEKAGKTAAQKLAAYREQLAKQECRAGLVTRLDCTAWLLNLRADDVANTPYAIAFCLVMPGSAVLFTDPSRVPTDIAEALAADGVELRPYDEAAAYLAAISEPVKILCDPSCTNAALFSAISGNPACSIREEKDPLILMKAVKNAGELACTRAAHLRDGAAMVRFQMELERRLAAGESLRETDIDPILHKYRSQAGDFLEESFGTIAAYGPNAAMMHYAPAVGSDAALEAHGFLLVDSGGTYLDGTTDITRTYPLGALTEQERDMYTTTLRAHIDLAMAVWMENMSGKQLDMLARQPFWSRMLDYRCGTGHGVSHVGAVHEGPQSLRANNDVVFVPGMVITDEPGYYEEGAVGVRIENELVCVEAGESEYGRFLKFEPLMFVPIDLKAVNVEELTAAELRWLNGYHAQVLEKLSPLLTAEERAWLAPRCAPIA